MKISATEPCKEWLENFALQDRSAAALLLDSLQYVEESTLRTGLIRLLEIDFGEERIEQPAIVIAARTGRELAQFGSSLEEVLAEENSSVAFENVFPGAPFSVEAGSESLCGNIIREFRTRHGRSFDLLSPNSTLDDMRTKRCRSIVLVSDFAGSGDQVVKAANLLTRNATIRSWRSFGWVRIHVILLAATPLGKKVVERARSVDHVSVLFMAHNFESIGWSDVQRNEVIRICRQYASPRLRSRYALGWNESKGLFLMQHSIPNNIPCVIWQDSGRGQRDAWSALLPRRTMPESLGRLLAMKAYDARFGSQMQSRQLSEFSVQLILTLEAIHRGARTVERLAIALGQTLPDCSRLVGQLQQRQLIDIDYRLTDAGHAELAEARISSSSRYQLKGSTRSYYPQTLRGVRNI